MANVYDTVCTGGTYATHGTEATRAAQAIMARGRYKLVFKVDTEEQARTGKADKKLTIHNTVVAM